MHFRTKLKLAMNYYCLVSQLVRRLEAISQVKAVGSLRHAKKTRHASSQILSFTIFLQLRTQETIIINLSLLKSQCWHNHELITAMMCML